MKKPDSAKPKEKANELGWVFAFLFPKKPKPIPPKPSATSSALPTVPPTASSSAPATPPALFVPTPPPAQPTTQPPVQAAPVQQPIAAKPPVVMPPVAPPPTPLPAAKAPTAKTATEKKGLTLDRTKIFPAFWTVTGGLSLLVNIILIVTLIILAQQLFVLKRLVGGHVLGGLYDNFVLMDQAHISTNIKVQDTIPINFTLPISQDTTVTLTEPTYIPNVMIVLNSGGLSINSPANITLPAGTNLPVHLQMDVPVSTNVPVTLNVPVDIPLDQTSLHEPFVGLQKVIGPFNSLLDPSITTASQVTDCQKPILDWFCNSFFDK